MGGEGEIEIERQRRRKMRRKKNGKQKESEKTKAIRRLGAKRVCWCLWQRNKIYPLHTGQNVCPIPVYQSKNSQAIVSKLPEK
jgi:predicted  nucleic acid-binding Zn ribbon protein